MKIKLRLALILYFVFTSFNMVSAQTKGNIHGRIVDADSKEALVGVNVYIKGTYYGAATDLEGNYRISNVNPGVYTIEVSMLGYKKVQNTGIIVNADETSNLDFKLEPTVLAFGQEVVVIGESPLFNIDETASKKTISSSEIAAEVVESIQPSMTSLESVK